MVTSKKTSPAATEPAEPPPARGLDLGGRLLRLLEALWRPAILLAAIVFFWWLATDRG